MRNIGTLYRTGHHRDRSCQFEEVRRVARALASTRKLNVVPCLPMPSSRSVVGAGDARWWSRCGKLCARAGHGCQPASLTPPRCHVECARASPRTPRRCVLLGPHAPARPRAPLRPRLCHNEAAAHAQPSRCVLTYSSKRVATATCHMSHAVPAMQRLHAHNF